MSLIAKIALIRTEIPKTIRQAMNTQNTIYAYSSRLSRLAKMRYTAKGMPAAKNKSTIIASLMQEILRRIAGNAGYIVLGIKRKVYRTFAACYNESEEVAFRYIADCNFLIQS